MRRIRDILLLPVYWFWALLVLFGAVVYGIFSMLPVDPSMITLIIGSFFFLPFILVSKALDRRK